MPAHTNQDFTRVHAQRFALWNALHISSGLIGLVAMGVTISIIFHELSSPLGCLMSLLAGSCGIFHDLWKGPRRHEPRGNPTRLSAISFFFCAWVWLEYTGVVGAALAIALCAMVGFGTIFADHRLSRI